MKIKEPIEIECFKGITINTTQMNKERLVNLKFGKFTIQLQKLDTDMLRIHRIE